MRRREFIAGVGSILAWPVAGLSAEEMKTLGLLLGGSPENANWKSYLSVVLQQLSSLGWIEGRNLRLEYRWAAGDAERMRTGAHELVALGPDAIFAGTSPTVPILQQVTASIPIIFALVIDPVALGYVKSLARPGGNTTGFTNFEPSMGGKWLSLLKEIAPSIKRVACMLNPDLDLEVARILLKPIRNAGQSFSVDITTAEVRNDNDIENSIRSLSANDGAFIYLPGNFNLQHLPRTIELAAHYHVPAIYGWDYMAAAGGLVSYGSAWEDEMRGVASYIDRVLRGTNPSDLPVRAPTKFKLVINLKTAKTLGLTVPVTLLVAADEVIE